MLVVYIALAAFIIGGAVITLSDSYAESPGSRYY